MATTCGDHVWRMCQATVKHAGSAQRSATRRSGAVLLHQRSRCSALRFCSRAAFRVCAHTCCTVCVLSALLLRRGRRQINHFDVGGAHAPPRRLFIFCFLLHNTSNPLLICVPTSVLFAACVAVAVHMTTIWLQIVIGPVRMVVVSPVCRLLIASQKVKQSQPCAAVRLMCVMISCCVARCVLAGALRWLAGCRQLCIEVDISLRALRLQRTLERTSHKLAAVAHPLLSRLRFCPQDEIRPQDCQLA